MHLSSFILGRKVDLCFTFYSAPYKQDNAIHLKYYIFLLRTFDYQLVALCLCVNIDSDLVSGL